MYHYVRSIHNIWIINLKEEQTALYTGIGFICGVLGKLIQLKIKDKK